MLEEIGDDNIQNGYFRDDVLYQMPQHGEKAGINFVQTAVIKEGSDII